MKPSKLSLAEKRETPLGSVDYSDQTSLHSQRMFDKFRVQLPLVVLSAAIFQLLFHFLFISEGAFFLAQVSFNSILVTTFANIIALLSYRRLRLFPGSRRMSFLLPAFATSYTISLIIILASRIPYSTQLLTVGAATAILMAGMFNAVNRRPSAEPLMVVRSKRTEKMIRDLPELNFKFCDMPADLIGAQNCIVVDLQSDLSAEWEQAIANATLAGTTVYHVKHIQESLTGRVQIDHLSENGFGSLAPNSLYFALKTIIDRIAAAIMLAPAIPIMLVAGLGIKLSSPGPIIFTQQRIGYRGTPFTLYKLRTMQNYSANDAGRDAAITEADDPRITKLGRVLRKTRIDELPQLFNVIMGEMSLIGPRPEVVKLSNWYSDSIDFYAYRHVVLPGITGWAQVKQGHVADTSQVYRKLQYDFYYIKHFSLWLDILIAFKTVAIILTSKGAK